MERGIRGEVRSKERITRTKRSKVITEAERISMTEKGSSILTVHVLKEFIKIESVENVSGMLSSVMKLLMLMVMLLLLPVLVLEVVVKVWPLLLLIMILLLLMSTSMTRMEVESIIKVMEKVLHVRERESLTIESIAS